MESRREDIGIDEEVSASAKKRNLGEVKEVRGE